jgi:hypothetical protein
MRSEQKNQKKLPAISAAVIASVAAAQCARAAPQVQTVFVIAMENHNWTQPAGDTSAPQQIFANVNAPYINSLVTPGNPNAAQVSYASAYHNVLATPTGANPSIHPSEPNYIWAEAGTNYGILNDNTPYGTGGTQANIGDTTFHLTGLMQGAGVSWKTYQEDTQVDASGKVLPQAQWTSPIWNAGGNFTAGPNANNAYNGSTQFNYAVKHNPMSFFRDTNGAGNNTNPANPSNLPAGNNAPLQQLQTDLTNNTVAKYNWITPNQFNDQHTALTGGYKPSFAPTTTLTGDAANIAQGDDFLKKIIPQIMASQAYQNNGAIVIWNDETEGANANDFNHTSMEIVISPLAKGNAYNSTINYTHSSDLKTMQEIFNVGSNAPGITGGVFLNDANNASDLSDLFIANAIPGTPTNLVPEPASLGLLGLGAVSLLARRKRNV